jgi:hypothetical protein
VPVKFDASLSSDPNGDSLTFEWDFDGDGLYSEIQDDSYTGQPDTPTHGFTSNYDGKAYVRVSDGKGGKAVCSIDVQVIAHPSKNIPLRSGVLAYDLGINQSHGDLLVLYSDGQIWKRTLADWFSTDTQVKPFGGVNNDKRILDVAPNGAFGVIGGQFAIWDESGNFCNWTQGGNGQKDCAAFDSTAGSYANSIACYWGSENSYMGTYYFYIWFQRWYPPYSQGSQQISEKLNSSGSYVIPTGIDQLYWNYIRALETAGDKIWFLEQPDFYCSRWGATGGGISGVWYDHAYFGTGAQGDADNTWYDAKDLTINNVGKLFVLDQLSDGGPRVKEFSEGAPGASLGGFGDSVTISGVPLRIEGSTHDAYVIVLHGTSSPSMISIFMPFEMPG